MFDELKKRYPPDKFPACAAALDLGIDVTLLEANVRLTPAERMRSLMRQLGLQQRLQEANLSPAQLEAIELRYRQEKLDYYGPQPELDSDHA